MIRMMLSDAQWDRIEPLLLGKAGDPGRSGTDNRLFLEAVLWLVRTGVPWRDLPEAFGRWNTVFRRFRRWACKGVFESIFTALSGDPDFEYALRVASPRNVTRGIWGKWSGSACQLLPDCPAPLFDRDGRSSVPTCRSEKHRAQGWTRPARRVAAKRLGLFRHEHGATVPQPSGRFQGTFW